MFNIEYDTPLSVVRLLGLTTDACVAQWLINQGMGSKSKIVRLLLTPILKMSVLLSKISAGEAKPETILTAPLVVKRREDYCQSQQAGLDALSTHFPKAILFLSRKVFHGSSFIMRGG